MCEVFMQTIEQDFTKEAAKGLVKILDGTYKKSDLKQVTPSVTQMGVETKLYYLGSLKTLRTCLMVL